MLCKISVSFILTMKQVTASMQIGLLIDFDYYLRLIKI